jgi:hypothetical protein
MNKSVLRGVGLLIAGVVLGAVLGVHFYSSASAPPMLIDARSFGLNSGEGDQNTALQAAISAAEATKSCVYIPSPANAPPSVGRANSYYNFNRPLSVTTWTCLKGDNMWTTTLRFWAGTDGIAQRTFGASPQNQIVISGLHILGQSSSTAVKSEQTGILNNDRIVAGLNDTSKFMAGTTTVSGTGIPAGTRVSAVDSASQIHISNSANQAGNSRLIFSGVAGAQTGLKFGPGTQYRLTDVVLDDWIDCVDAQGGAGSAGVGRSAFTNVLCGQSSYPNPSNPTRYGVYSYSAGRGGGQLQMMDWLQGEIRGQINYASQYYTTTGTNGRNGTWFDFHSKFWLWQSSGIQVYTRAQSGKQYSLMTQGRDYTLWDCGASPCGGSGGTQVFGDTVDGALSTAPDPMVVTGVRDLSGLAVGMAVYGVGIPDRTFITSLAPNGPGTVRISDASSVTGTESLQFTTINEAKCASGGPRPTGCTQGLNFEIRFVLPPPAGNDHVLIAYNDPYGLAGIKLTSGASDNNFVPIIASGYPVLFNDQSGSGNNRWAPDYIEITHKCAVIGPRVTGDRLRIPTSSSASANGAAAGLSGCPPSVAGTIDPTATALTEEYNGNHVPADYRAASNGFTVTIPCYAGVEVLNPTSALASGTVNMCAAPVDGQAAALASTQAISSLTVSGNGNRLNRGLATLPAGGSAKWKYDGKTGTWLRCDAC